LTEPFYAGSVATDVGLYVTCSFSPDFVALSAAASFAVAFAWVVFLILTYEMWAAIQDGHVRTTPGKAVCYLFIPLYGLHWLFLAYWGFAKDCSAYIDRHDDIHSAAFKLPVGLFLSYPVVMVATLALFMSQVILEIVGVLALGLAAGTLANFGFLAEEVIMVVMVVRVCDAVNNLPVPSCMAVKQ
jgi:hypothetical protein